jgi:hypothetical protein
VTRRAALALLAAVGAAAPATVAAHGSAPASPVIVARPGVLTAERAATLTFLHDAPDVRFRCRLDGGRERTCTSPHRIEGLADGWHRFEVVARDERGRRGRPAVAVWAVDATPPPRPVITRKQNALAFTGARTTCSLDGAAAEACTSPAEYRDLDPGEHRFAVTAHDIAGNAATSELEWTVSLRPAVDTGAATGTRTTSATVSGTARDATYSFEYGTSTDYGSRTAAAPADGAATATLTGLRPDTTYHFRIVASTCGGCEAGTARGADATLRTAGITTYQNPVYGGLPDPMALEVDGTYYAYGTGERFPMARSSDFVHWTGIGPAMTARPKWVPQTGEWNPWAPSVLRRDGACPGTGSSECFVMYYTGLNNSLAPPVNCIGVAVATSPSGPFADTGILDTDPPSQDSSGRPIGCGDDNGHSNIDAAPFIDPATGSGYLYLSTGHEPSTAWRRTIGVMPLSEDRLHAAGPRTPLFSYSQPWEDIVVEAPWVTRHGDGYYLFYSGGVFTNDSYGLGYAYAQSPAGPFTKPADAQLMKTEQLVEGPGGGSLVEGPHGGDWLVYHGRAAAGSARTLRVDPLKWGSPPEVTVRGPSTTPRTLP